MRSADSKIKIGTSGWHYNHWLGPFYPKNTPKSQWFEYYSRHFDTVEINNTFYQLPKQQTIENWFIQAPKNFTYTVKANRYITHIKRLKDSAEPLKNFFERIEALQHTLGPILYQLPPNLQKDLHRLQAFIKLLPKNRIAVFEFRHNSWYSQETFDLLDKLKCVFCIHDMPSLITPKIITANTIYIRFHGQNEKYHGCYTKQKMKKWAEWINENSKNARAVYAYFNNDINAYAIKNAKNLKQNLTALSNA